MCIYHSQQVGCGWWWATEVEGLQWPLMLWWDEVLGRACSIRPHECGLLGCDWQWNAVCSLGKPCYRWAQVLFTSCRSNDCFFRFESFPAYRLHFQPINSGTRFLHNTLKILFWRVGKINQINSTRKLFRLWLDKCLGCPCLKQNSTTCRTRTRSYGEEESPLRLK